MPYPINMAHKLARQLTKVRKDGTLPYLRPDEKTQVTVEYDENNKPIRLDAIVVSSQHAPEVSQEQIHEDIKKYVIDAIVDPAMVDAIYTLHRPLLLLLQPPQRLHHLPRRPQLAQQRRQELV